MNRIWFPQLLRGLAAVFVVISHLFVVPLPYMGQLLYDKTLVGSTFSTANILQRVYFFLSDNFVNLGAFGVGIFFLISGFVISFSVERRSSCGFLVNRLIRIYPVVTVALVLDVLIIALYHLLKFNHFPPSINLADFVTNGFIFLRPLLGGNHVDGVLWTLEIELFFYFIMFLFGRKILSKPINYIISLSILFIVFIFIRYITIDSSLLVQKVEKLKPFISFCYHSIPHLLLMFVGIAYYSFYKKNWCRKVFMFTMVYAFVLCSISYTLLYRQNLILAVSYFLIPFTTWLLFYGLDVKKRLPYSKVLNYLANISFSLYLTHQILGFALESLLITKLNLNIYFAIFISFVICFLWSSIIFYIVERKSQVWSKSF